MILATMYLLLLQVTQPSPIIRLVKMKPAPPEEPPSTSVCDLPKRLGGSGTKTFLEDCHPKEALGRFKTVPLPLASFGTHPVVCCPARQSQTSICFESDPDCVIYRGVTDYEGQGEEEEEEEEYKVPTFSEGDCGPYDERFQVTSQCVPLTQCPGNLDSPTAPDNNFPCSFDTEKNQLMICCPPENVTQPQDLVQPPRFPTRSGEARRVKDKSDLCARWKRHGACRLDQDFLLVEDDPSSKVYSRDMFGLMQMSCAETCGWVESGCRDEDERCEEWARRGQCIRSPLFMAHTCRESCGVCGFLSPENKELQRVDGKSYTDFTMEDFDCGRFKDLTEIDDEDAEDDISYLFDLRREEEPPNSATDDDLEVFSFSVDDKNIFCGATVVNDRWMISAAHCHNQFLDLAKGRTEVRAEVIRPNTKFIETIEIKRVYVHPNYHYPSLYNDVAVLELGRRIAFDHEKYGDSPMCLNQNQDEEAFSGWVASLEGYGTTEAGTRGELLTTNVTVITSEECKEMMTYNITKKAQIRKKGTEALPYGLSGMFCAQGRVGEDGVFTGPCKGRGDSGGPLFTVDRHSGEVVVLLGLVSGGVGCGQGVPAWYTSIATHHSWLRCVVDRSLQFNNNKQQVEDACRTSVMPEPTCVQPEDLIFGIEEFIKYNEAQARQRSDFVKKELCEGK